jgi:peptide chain release factor subunit 1
LTEWFLDSYKKYGSHLEIITDKSSEGNQFVKGFGGIGGILRYKMETTNCDVDVEEAFNEDDFI